MFIVGEAPEGGLTARALGESIFTETDDIESLHRYVREACHFDEDKMLKVIRLHFTHEELIAV